MKYDFFPALSLSLLCLSLSACSGFINPPGSQTAFLPTTRVVEKPIERPVASAPSRAEFMTSLDPDIRKAYALYQKTGKAPTISTQDFLQFPFGATEPLIYCQPLHACDIALESGEQITHIFLGDTARWKYDEAMSGAGADIQPHVIIKPTDNDLSTNAVITTTRRAYHLGLVSKPDAYVRQVSFWYPDDIAARWDKINADAQAKWSEDNQTTVASLPNISVSNLDFHYAISRPFLGSGPDWAPVRAFNDGTHVYLEMPPGMRTSNAPVLFVVGSDGQNNLVNYRIRGNYYIVDLLFREAVLVAGVGSGQQRVTITHNA